MKNILSQEDAHAILGVKKCTVCGELKQLDQFYKRKQMLDGHRSECKECNDASIHVRFINKVAQEVKEPKQYPESLVMPYAEKHHNMWERIIIGSLFVLTVITMTYVWLDGATK